MFVDINVSEEYAGYFFMIEVVTLAGLRKMVTHTYGEGGRGDRT
jgi:hypothetical protein